MLKHINHDDRRIAGAKGFTLIELLVVIIILGILAAVVVFAVGGVQDKGQDSACKTDLRTITVAVQAWNADSQSATPNVATDWPTDMQDLVDGEFIDSASTLHTVSGTGNAEPTITAVGKCA